jgi:phenylpyruvate tautomerase PptA (4-oxalocrotonate tautomerase family)
VPILDVEVVVRSEESLSPDLAARLADACGEIFGSAPGDTWVKVHAILRMRYAENGGNLPGDFYPVFVKVLKAKLPSPAAMQTEVAGLTSAVAQTCGRPQENVHIIYEPEGAGRVAFGGDIVSG